MSAPVRITMLSDRSPYLHGFERVEDRLDGSKWHRRRDRLTVIRSWSSELDGRSWLHVSMSHPDRLPSYKTVRDVKRVFVGDDQTALQVFPPVSQHVNQHPFCLHLWCCLDGDVTPDFTRGGRSI